MLDLDAIKKRAKGIAYRADIQALIAEVERLRKEVEKPLTNPPGVLYLK